MEKLRHVHAQPLDLTSLKWHYLICFIYFFVPVSDTTPPQQQQRDLSLVILYNKACKGLYCFPQFHKKSSISNYSPNAFV